MTLRRIISVLIGAVLFCSCEEGIPTPDGLGFPEFLSVRAEGRGKAFTLIADLSSSRVDDCGFILTYPSGESVRLAGALDERSFTASAKNLKFSQMYAFKAFFIVEGEEHYSREYTFLTGDDDGNVFVEDDAFLAYLLAHFDKNHDGKLQPTEAETIHTIETGPLGIKSLVGIECMPNLTKLDCAGNLITEIDLSDNPKMRQIICSPMEDESHHNLLDVIYIPPGPTDALTESICSLAVPEETIFCVRYENDPRVGSLVEADGLKGILFWVNDELDLGLMVSLDEVDHLPWEEAVRWSEAYDGGGWGMPEIDNLVLLHRAFYPVSKTLIALGYPRLCNSNSCYWSITPIEETYAYLQRARLWDGYVLTEMGLDEQASSTANITRAVRSCSIENLKFCGLD